MDFVEGLPKSKGFDTFLWWWTYFPNMLTLYPSDIHSLLKG
jgi:hypothetical protein